MNSTPCPLCDARDSRKLFNAKTSQAEFNIIQCLQCGLARTFPMPDDDVLELHNKSQYYGEKENKFIPVLQNIRDRVSEIRARKYLSLIPITGRRPKILDIGCAEGRLLRSFLKLGCDCNGIEHSEYPRERFLDSDKINYMVGSLDSLELEGDSYDIIIMWHVLEHMDDPDETIRTIFHLLKSDGIFILAVPNFSGREARVFKNNWFHLDIPWHKYHFTESSMGFLLEKNCFSKLKSTSFCIEQGIYGLVQSILNSMGWQKNELYEVMKGNIQYGRVFSVIMQAIIAITFFIPCIFLSMIISTTGNGSVLKLVLTKYDKSRGSN